MSTVKKEVKSRLVERELEGNSELTLSDNILDQVAYLHKEVGAAEWSGILVYEILEGSIEDHKNLKLKVHEVLPMDVGTSTYTEYELDPEGDDYTFDNISRVMMDPKLKIGHIHTHHNMKCYFSGTDEQELHDNAPAHNYYLSLIVNFRRPDEWCAKIAYVGKEEQEGTVTSSYVGTEGDIIKSEMKVSNETDVLYTIDVDIETETVLEMPKEFTDRVTELKKPKPASNNWAWARHYTPGQYSRQYSAAGSRLAGIGSSWQRGQGWQGSLFDSDHGDIVDLPDASPLESLPLVKDVTKESMIEFTNKLVSLKEFPNTTLENTLKVLEDTFYKTPHVASTEVEKDIYLEAVANYFPDVFEKHFKVEPNVDSVNDILLKMEEYALNSTSGQEMPDEILSTLWLL